MMFNISFKSIFCWHRWERAWYSDMLSTYECQKCGVYKNKEEHNFHL